MTDFAVFAYRKRRAERLAARGLKPKQYRKSKDLKKLTEKPQVPTYHADAPDGDEEQQNNRRGGPRDSGGGHGNTKLPFGLCLKYGIEIGADWTPKDAWEALAGKGITPGEIYKKLKTGEELGPDVAPEPPKKEPVKTIDMGEKYFMSGLKARKGWGYRGATPWVLEGTAEWKDTVPEEDRKGYRSSWLGKFATLTDMYHYLKKHGIEEFEDPETGEIVNPSEMDLPKMVYTDGERGYSALTLGMKKDRYAITGTDFEGKKKAVEDFSTMAGVTAWLEKHGISEEDCKRSPALKKREAERVSWLTSDKKEFCEVDGIKYGDLHIKRDYYGRIMLTGEAEDGDMLSRAFKSRTDAIKFLKDQNVEKLRGEDKEIINPTEYAIPDAIAELDGKSYQKLELRVLGDSLRLYGIDLDGMEDSITYMTSRETVSQFRKRLKDTYELPEGIVGETEEAKAYMAGRAEEDAIRDKRIREFADKAIPVYGSKYMDVHLEKSGSGYELKGYDEYGMERRIAYQSDITDMISKFVERYSLNPDEIIKDKDLRAEYDKVQELKRDFDSKCITFGSYQYVGVELVKEADDEFHIIGYDRDGKRHNITYIGDLFDVEESARRKGVDDISQFALSAEVKKALQDHETRVREFESKSTTLSDGRKYADLFVAPEGGYEYSIKGYDSKGKLVRVTGYSRSMFDTMEEAEKLGLKTEDLPKESDETKKAYEDYRRVKEKFSSESKPFGSKSYMDLELTYEDGWYRVKGTDIRGRRRTILESTSVSKIETDMEAETGDSGSFFSIDKSESMKERMKQVEKAKYAVATGEYYDMGIDGAAFKSIHADKIGDKWSIKGVDIDGTEKQIVEASDWDDVVETLESFHVKDYKLLTKDRTYERPTDGMHHVMLMRSTDGMFKVYADTETKGKHAEVHSSATEEEARQWISDNNIDTGNIRTRGMNPNDDKPRTHTQKSLAKFDTYRMDKLDGSFIDDMTDDEKKLAAEMLTTIFTEGSYRVARSTSSFGGIIENGYKSQVETGKGGYGAAKGKDLRKGASNKFYGHGGLDDTEYEKCGYIGLKDEAEDWNDDGHPGYGGSSPLTYTLRKEAVQDRTTYTYGDSLNTRYSLTSAGYAGPAPTIEGLTSLGSKSSLQRVLKAYQEYKDGQIDYSTMFERIRRSANNGYIELQFHGPVTVQDIERVSFESERDLANAFNKMSVTRRKKVVKLLQENHVDMIYREGRWTEFKDAWEYVRAHYPDAFTD